MLEILMQASIPNMGGVAIINVKMFLHYGSYFAINYYASFLCKGVAR
jgi:hypothetical protein